MPDFKLPRGSGLLLFVPVLWWGLLGDGSGTDAPSSTTLNKLRCTGSCCVLPVFISFVCFRLFRVAFLSVCIHSECVGVVAGPSSSKRPDITYGCWGFAGSLTLQQMGTRNFEFRTLSQICWVGSPVRVNYVTLDRPLPNQVRSELPGGTGDI